MWECDLFDGGVQTVSSAAGQRGCFSGRVRNQVPRYSGWKRIAEPCSQYETNDQKPSTAI